MTIISAITSVFDAMGEWITSSVQDTTALFYNAETGLTLVGTLALMGLSISIVMMLINVVKSFLRFQ